MFTFNKITKIAFLSSALVVFSGSGFAGSWYNYGCEKVLLSPQVCFYTGENYSGNWYCESGERTVNEVNKIPWKMNIESIKLIDGASVKIYNEYNRNGDYMFVQKSIKELNSDFANKVKSYRTVEPDEKEDIAPSWWWNEMCRYNY